MPPSMSSLSYKWSQLAGHSPCTGHSVLQVIPTGRPPSVYWTLCPTSGPNWHATLNVQSILQVVPTGRPLSMYWTLCPTSGPNWQATLHVLDTLSYTWSQLACHPPCSGHSVLQVVPTGMPPSMSSLSYKWSQLAGHPPCSGHSVLQVVPTGMPPSMSSLSYKWSQLAGHPPCTGHSVLQVVPTGRPLSMYWTLCPTSGPNWQATLHVLDTLSYKWSQLAGHSPCTGHSVLQVVPTGMPLSMYWTLSYKWSQLAGHSPGGPMRNSSYGMVTYSNQGGNPPATQETE